MKYLLGFLVGLFIASAGAHYVPCQYENERQPQCGYEQSVNPLTGKLETHYVCR